MRTLRHLRPLGDIRPPRLAAALLRAFAEPASRSALLGDLEEEFRALTAAGTGSSAARWYWVQALRSIGPLLAWRLEASRPVQAISGTLVGAITAVVSAMLVGSFFETLLGAPMDPELPLIVAVVTSCAFVSSTCAGCASSWAAGGPSRWMLAVVGLVVIGPEVTHVLFHPHADAGLRALVPVVSAVMAAAGGLRLARLLSRHRATEEETP